MATHGWVTSVRDYDGERARAALTLTPAEDGHPLDKKDPKAKTTAGAKSAPAAKQASKAPAMYDPLSGGGDEVTSDPLSLAAAEADNPMAATRDHLSLAASAASSTSAANAMSVMDDSFEPWMAKRQGILTKYTTNEKLTIVSSYLDDVGAAKVMKTGAGADQVKSRLEQLDDFEDGSLQEMLDLSQQDYVNKIKALNEELRSAWAAEQRVKALKIVIQCSKLLADTSVIQFYPSKFVLITDILDTFGKLVYERLVEKAAYVPPGSSVPQKLPANFTPDMVPPRAKETARNWFFKIASIRELIPRLYVECAILRSYSLLQQGEYQAALARLTHMMRGIGDPLVALYARCYMCRVGVLVAPEVRGHLLNNFNDFMKTYGQLSGSTVQNQLAVQRVDFPTYLNLFTPGLDWILQCVAYKAAESVLVDILGVCQDTTNSSLLLNSIMSAFPPQYISSRAMRFTELIKDASETGIPMQHLFRSLGMNVTLSPPPKEQQLGILSEVWKVVMKIKDPQEYISCAEVWIEYPVKNFGKREVNAMLGDIIKHMLADRAFEQFYPQLQSVLGKMLTHMKDFGVIFSMDNFMPFIDLFQKDRVKLEVCKGVLEAFVRNHAELTNDPVILNAMMYICKTLHDSMTAMTFEDERRQISTLIGGFLSKVSFGRDFEQTLNFFVEARATFSNLDMVLYSLVHSVNLLTMRTLKVVNGKHNRKTAGFVRSCVAYTYITIPSISGHFERLRLYLQSGRVALVNQALTQADEFFKAAIALVAEVPQTIEMDKQLKDTEPMLEEYLYDFLSTLLVVPDSPTQGVLSIVKALLNQVAEYNWNVDSDAIARVYMRSLSLLAGISQPRYAYRIDGVDSNDALYAAGAKFLQEVNLVVDRMLDQVLGHLKELTGGDAAMKRRSKIALQLMMHVVSLADMTQPKTVSLAMNLWKLANVETVQEDVVTALARLSKQGRPGTAAILGKIGH